MKTCKKRGSRFIDRTGMRYGRLTVRSFAGTRGKSSLWLCTCDCGNEIIVRSTGFSGNPTKSCGCLRAIKAREVHTKHGATRDGRCTPEYEVWTRMLRRCRNPNVPSYRNYGGRGITVCARWVKSFANFLADMGNRPSARHSIDRIDTNGDYTPENCRWATCTEQGRNKRTTKLTMQKARAIRKMLKAGVYQEDIASMYGVSPSSISLVKLNKTWKENHHGSVANI